MKLVIVESPYAGNVQHNLWYAWACIRDSLLRGEAPMASHVIYTLPTVLDDNIPLERSMGIQAGYAWAEKADLIAFYTDLGMSPGMQEALNVYAEIAYRPFEYRTIPGWSDFNAQR